MRPSREPQGRGVLALSRRSFSHKRSRSGSGGIRRRPGRWWRPSWRPAGYSS